MSHFSNFTEGARKAVVEATRVARKTDSPSTEAIHLLIALTETPGGARTILEDLGNDPELLADSLKKHLTGKNLKPGKKTEDSATGESFRAALDRAFRVSLRNDRGTYVGTEHLLLALLELGDEEYINFLVEPKGIVVRANEAVERLREEKQEAEGEGELVRAIAAAGNKGRGKGEKVGSLLEAHGTNLTRAAKQGKFTPVIGRERELKQIMQILSCRGKNNPILLGEPGVGKSAIIEELAGRLDSPSTPVGLRGKEIYMVDLASLVAGTTYRGDFESRVQKLIDEAKHRQVILFIDEIHTAIGAGRTDGSSGDLANFLKPSLARGELQTIGATTIKEYRKHFEADPAFERRFQPLDIKEPTVRETVDILTGLRPHYEDWHRVTFTDGALKAAATLSDRYIRSRFLPDKAVTLLDKAGAYARFNAVVEASSKVQDLDEELEQLRTKRGEAVEAEQYDVAAALKTQELEVETERDQIVAEQLRRSDTPIVDENTVAILIAEDTGTPVANVTVDERSRLSRMEEILGGEVIGQPTAIRSLSRTIRRQRAGLKDANRPIGSFIFAGATGVGKTQMARSLAKFLFGRERDMIALDMSEYSEKHAVSRLVGAAPGYVGYENGGQLTEAVQQKPFSVVLFDEIEKAHPDVFDLLLQILEEGRLTDGHGREVDFRNTIIILTSNLGAREITANPIGFSGGNSTDRDEDNQRRVKAALMQQCKPELINRLDEIIVFPSLTEESVQKIVSVFVDRLALKLVELGFVLNVSDSARQQLGSEGYDPKMGARPLRRVIQKRVEDPLAEMLIASLIEGDGVDVDWNGEEFLFDGLTVEDIEVRAGILA